MMVLGQYGIWTFFLISGMIIPLSITEDSFKIKHLKNFLLKRMIRVEVPYIASIIFILFVTFIFAQRNNIEFTISIGQFLHHILFLIPFSRFEWYTPIYWTLAIEVQFYLAVGLFYYSRSFMNKQAAILVLLLFGLLNFAIDDNRLLFNYSTVFLQGVILYFIKMKKMNMSLGFFLVGVCLTAIAITHSVNVAIFCLVTILIIQFVEIKNKLLIQLGNISYSLYLTHGLIGGNILYLFTRYATNYMEKTLLVIGALITSLIFSYVFYRLIEKPSRKLYKTIAIDQKGVVHR